MGRGVWRALRVASGGGPSIPTGAPAACGREGNRVGQGVGRQSRRGRGQAAFSFGRIHSDCRARRQARPASPRTTAGHRERGERRGVAIMFVSMGRPFESGLGCTVCQVSCLVFACFCLGSIDPWVQDTHELLGFVGWYYAMLWCFAVGVSLAPPPPRRASLVVAVARPAVSFPPRKNIHAVFLPLFRNLPSKSTPRPSYQNYSTTNYLDFSLSAPSSPSHAPDSGPSSTAKAAETRPSTTRSTPRADHFLYSTTSRKSTSPRAYWLMAAACRLPWV